jgi:hypothetical protein
VAEPERARREVGGGWRKQAERLGRGCEEIAGRLSMSCALMSFTQPQRHDHGAVTQPAGAVFFPQMHFRA